MSQRFGPERVAELVAAWGPEAFLAVVGADRPHLVAVTVSVVGDGTLQTRAGRRSGRFAAERPGVTLLWPPGPQDPDHSLLIDGTAAVEETTGTLVITPVAGVLHVQRRNEDGSC